MKDRLTIDSIVPTLTLHWDQSFMSLQWPARSVTATILVGRELKPVFEMRSIPTSHTFPHWLTPSCTDSVKRYPGICMSIIPGALIGSVTSLWLGLSICWSVCWSVALSVDGGSICHDFLKGRQVALPCSYRRICLIFLFKSIGLADKMSGSRSNSIYLFVMAIYVHT